MRRRWLKAAVAVLLVGLLGTGVWAVYYSSWFAVSRVVVTGTHRLTVGEVEAAARVPVGQPIVRVDISRIRRDVQAISQVGAVTVTTFWPDTVRISVVERAPVAVVRSASGGFRMLDTYGVDLGPLTERPAALPLIELDPATIAPATLRAAATVAASLSPALKAKVRSISAVTANSVTLQLVKGPIVRWGDDTDGAIKARVLLALLKHPAAVYDVSAPYAPTTAKVGP
jgi:cell division protein FtsQ